MIGLGLIDPKMVENGRPQKEVESTGKRRESECKHCSKTKVFSAWVGSGRA